MSNENQTPPEDPNYQPPGDDNEDEQGSSSALVRIDQNALASIAKSEAMAQVDVAHAYPRDLKKFEKRAIEMATSDAATAASCMYTLKRTEYDKVLKKRVKKDIVGPSIRLSEIVASCYGNIHVGSRPIDIGDSTVTCQGVAWDLENNNRITVEVSRGITGSSGRKYGNDMIVLTLNATSAIARRNATFSVVPRAYVARIFERVRHVATGGGKPLQERRELVIKPFANLGVNVARILARVERSSIDELGIDDLEILAGLYTRLKQGDPVDELFPAPQPKQEPQPQAQEPMPGSAQEGQRVDVGKKAEPVAEAKPEPATAVTATTSGTASATPAETKLSEVAAKKGGGAQISFGVEQKDPDRAAAEPTPEEMERLGKAKAP
jgi:hypothetical protein